MHSSVHEIRQRLLNLLLRAFIVVLFLSFLIFTLLIGYFLTSSSTPIPFPFISTLEGYYFAKGSWDGVESVFNDVDGLDQMSSLMLDKDHRIVLDRRPDSVSGASTTPTVTLAQLQTSVFTPMCSGCHNGAGTQLPGVMNLSSASSSFTALVGVASLEVPAMQRVVQAAGRVLCRDREYTGAGGRGHRRRGLVVERLHGLFSFL